MTRHTVALTVLSMVLVGCSCSQGGRASGESTAPEPAEAEPIRAAPPAASEVPAGTVALRGRLEPPRRVAIVVENGGDAAFGLRRALTVEREEGGGWSEVEGIVNLWVLTECQPAGRPMYWEGGAVECVEVPPGGRFESVPWNGDIGDAQCACEECGPVPAGRYRFVATRCEGGRLEGEPFDLP